MTRAKYRHLKSIVIEQTGGTNDNVLKLCKMCTLSKSAFISSAEKFKMSEQNSGRITNITTSYVLCNICAKYTLCAMNLCYRNVCVCVCGACICLCVVCLSVQCACVCVCVCVCVRKRERQC